MVNYYIYARDCSFSTFNNKHYHSNGLKTLEQFKRDVENIKEQPLAAGEPPTESKIIYLHWGDDCWNVDEDETRMAYLKLNCEQMGTEPEWIIQHLKHKYIAEKNDRIKLLYIITDGLISNESAKRCFRWNEFMDYETVVFHAFNEEPGKVDLSVAASFFKSRCMVYRNNKLYVSTDLSKEFDYDSINAYNFTAEKNQLKSYITLKFIDEFNRDIDTLEEIEKLKMLRDRLLDELSPETINVKAIEVNTETRHNNLFLRKFVDTDLNNNLTVAVVGVKIDIEKSISALINYIVRDEKSFSFDSLTFDAELDESVEEDHIHEITFTDEQEFEIFDLILEDDVEIPYGNRILVAAT